MTCNMDAPLVAQYRAAGIPVYNAEFVLTGALRQVLDYETWIIV